MGIWNSHAYVGHQLDPPKVNLFCAISSQKVYGPFFIAEEIVTGMSYLDILHLWLMAQLQNIGKFIFQQDGSPAHFHSEFRQYLNTVLPGRWIGHASGNDQPLMLWPPRYPDITTYGFFGVDMSKTTYSSQTATWPPWPKGTDHCSSEEYQCTHVDAFMARTWISYRCVLCHLWCIHQTFQVVKRKLFQFSCGCEQLH